MLKLGAGAPAVVARGAAPQWTPDGASLVYQDEDRQLVVGGTTVTADEDIHPFPVRFLPDVYGRDDHLWQLLNRSPQAPAEQIALVSRPRG